MVLDDTPGRRGMKIKLLNLSTVFMVSLAGIALVQARDNGLSVAEVRDYRNMLRVNEKPVDMVEETKLMCAPPLSIYGPHYDPGVVYYINEIARRGISTFPDSRLFPVGSVIVKEKQERRTQDSVQIITVMKKVRQDRAEDSWEYKMYDTRNWTEIDSARSGAVNGTCIGCHRRYKDNDYVSSKGIQLLLGK
jgi:hypothetical protein